MMTDTSQPLDLFAGDPAPMFGDSVLTQAIRRRMEEIREAGKMTAEREVLVALALEAAEAVGRGKAKGRAIGGEVEQVRAILAELRDEEETQDGELTPEMREFFAAFEVSPNAE